MEWFFTATHTSCGTWDSYIPVGTIENFDHLAQVKMEHYGKSNTGGKNIVHKDAAANQYTNEMVKWLFKFTYFYVNVIPMEIVIESKFIINII